MGKQGDKKPKSNAKVEKEVAKPTTVGDINKQNNAKKK
jgi:hypothetical protein